MASDYSPLKSDTSPALARLEQLFNDHVDAVFNVAHRVVWNHADAEDVAQTAFIRAYAGLDQLRDQNRVRPWLLQIAYREAIAVVRRRRETPTDPTSLPERPSQLRCPAESAVAADVARIITAALADLDQDERMAVVLRDVEGLAMSEVAHVLDVGLSAAKMRVHRGRGSLRSLLHPQEVADAL